MSLVSLQKWIVGADPRSLEAPVPAQNISRQPTQDNHRCRDRFETCPYLATHYHCRILSTCLPCSAQAGWFKTMTTKRYAEGSFFSRG
jgi:hypothetical protein